MRWNRTRRADRTDRLIRSYFERRIDLVEVPQPPVRPPAGARREHMSRSAGAPFIRALPNLVCALALAAGLAVVAVNIGRPSHLAALLEARADQQGWTTSAPAALDSARKTISLSLNGG